jgi:hypothetical protein
MIPTGMNMDYDEFKSVTYMTHTIKCPQCGQERNWTVDDVDRSVFATPPGGKRH